MKRSRESAGPGRLARLDHRVAPRLATAVRAMGRAGRRLGAASGPPGRFTVRVAQRNPTLATAVVTVVAVTALILATGGDRHHAVAPAPPSPEVVLPGDLLGPTTGESVSAYLPVAQTRRNQLDVTSAPEVTAVVDFNGYLTASTTDSVLGAQAGVQVIRAFAASAAGGDVHAVSLSPGSALSSELARLRADAHQVVVNYRKHVALAKVAPTKANEQVVTAYADVAKQARIDSAGLGATVGCVFAVVVTAPPAALEALSNASDVRVLDPAPPSIPRQDLMIVPLEPQVVGTVEALAFAGE